MGDRAAVSYERSATPLLLGEFTDLSHFCGWLGKKIGYRTKGRLAFAEQSVAAPATAPCVAASHSR
jgi:hypothetical protein